MGIFIILFAIIIAILLLMSSKTEAKPVKHKTTSYSSYSSASSKTFKIAGISRRCNKKDIGIIIGAVVNENDNPHDPYAKSIIANYGQRNQKHLGYIAKSDQYYYEGLAKNTTELPFVGFIEEFETDDNRMAIFGKIKVFSGKETDVENAMTETMMHITDAFRVSNYNKRIEMLDNI